jgi:hypothetical protein
MSSASRKAQRVPVRGEDLARAVGRAVVDHDQLVAGMRLPQHAVHRVLDVTAVVVGDDDDADHLM